MSLSAIAAICTLAHLALTIWLIFKWQSAVLRERRLLDKLDELEKQP